MSPRKLGVLLVVWPTMAYGQILELAGHRFTDNVRVLEPSEYLPRDIFSQLQKTPNLLPGPVAVGSVNGITYLYRGNAKGLLAGLPETDWQRLSAANSWAVDCSRDAIDDSLSCRLTRENLLLSVRDSGFVTVLIGQNHYPGSEVAIRVDGQVAAQTLAPGFTGASASAVVDQLLTGDSVTTRFRQWPYQASIDKRISLYGFKEALTFLYWLRRAMQ